MPLGVKVFEELRSMFEDLVFCWFLMLFFFFFLPSFCELASPDL